MGFPTPRVSRAVSSCLCCRVRFCLFYPTWRTAWFPVNCYEQGEALLKNSIDEARRAGYVTSRKIRVALDTTPTLGKGAVKDTYNLLADGIEKLACRLAE